MLSSAAPTFADPSALTEHNLQRIEREWLDSGPNNYLVPTSLETDVADLIHTVRVLRSYIADGPHVRRMKR